MLHPDFECNEPRGKDALGYVHRVYHLQERPQDLIGDDTRVLESRQGNTVNSYRGC